MLAIVLKLDTLELTVPKFHQSLIVVPTLTVLHARTVLSTAHGVLVSLVTAHVFRNRNALKAIPLCLALQPLSIMSLIHAPMVAVVTEAVMTENVTVPLAGLEMTAVLLIQ